MVTCYIFIDHIFTSYFDVKYLICVSRQVTNNTWWSCAVGSTELVWSNVYIGFYVKGTFSFGYEVEPSTFQSFSKSTIKVVHLHYSVCDNGGIYVVVYL